MESDSTQKNQGVELIFKEALDTTEKAFVDRGFEEHAMATTGHDGSISQFAVVAKSENVLIGALTARLFWGSLHIRHLVVAPDQRGQGIGKMLMEAAFAYGRQNKCRFANVETMSFQALDFYRRLGFKVDFSREGYDCGCSFYYLSRDL
ncbi:MAG: GNAT family N-acetyltransferase [Verrucomicrobia bacterium]|nr:GNAT family N-acetyltransferase [Verrucomicrobiota bacterium]